MKKLFKGILITSLSVISVSVCLLSAGCGCSDDKNKDKAATTSSVEGSSAFATEDITQLPTDPATQADSEQDATLPPSDSSIVVPTQQGQESKYFSASFNPTKAVDTSTNEECSLREVFGSSYSGGSLVFYDNGTFADNLLATSENTGGYAISGDTLYATYSNDKNMKITVTSWSDSEPAEIIVNYGGYDVYFSR